ncbi:MAG: hypothetical protein CSA05_01255 [Bacteroidia bacterium]|nr:MAG: hypothetical protein CSA05_01255 [Bacteroidia bacterium]
MANVNGFKYVLLLGGVLFCMLSHAQDKARRKYIKWQASKAVSKSANQNFLRFEAAEYFDETALLPHFSGIEQNVSTNSRVRLNNLRFEALTDEEKRNVALPADLQSAIKITQSIQYARKIPYITYHFVPLRKNKISGKIEKLLEFDIEIFESQERNPIKPKLKHTYKASSVLESGTWIKIKVEKDGVYRLSINELVNLGISNPQQLRLFGFGGGMLPISNAEPNLDDLIENRIHLTNEAAYFYLRGPVEWTYDKEKEMFLHKEHELSEHAYYFLTSDYPQNSPARIPMKKIITLDANNFVNTFTDYQYHEKRDTNLLKSGSTWYGELFDTYTTRIIPFTFRHIVVGSELKTNVSLIARSPLRSEYEISINEQSKRMKNYATHFEVTSAKASKADSVFVFKALSDNVDVNIHYIKPTASSSGWLDYVVLNAKRHLVMSDEQMIFTHKQNEETEKITAFMLDNVDEGLKIWDITNPFEVSEIKYNISGKLARFKYKTRQGIYRFVAFYEKANLFSPITEDPKKNDVGAIENQNLHALPQPEMIIVAQPEMLPYAEEIAAFHKKRDKLKSVVVTPEEIYNEFSSGTPDIAAIRNFVRMFYDRAQNDAEAPKYLLLFGDGTYDNKRLAVGQTALLPTYQRKESLSPTKSFVTDDFFGLLDENEGGHDGLVDIGIGRIPVDTKEEARAVLDKIYNYYDNKNAMGAWRNVICFIGDDEDSNRHILDADALANMVALSNPEFNLDKIYLDAYPQQTIAGGERYPAVNYAIEKRIDKGALIVNYSGHGNEERLADENIINFHDIQEWKNFNKLPIFLTATCEFSRYDDHFLTTAGEMILLNPVGGGVAMFTTTRLVYASENFKLNKSFYNIIFKRDENGKPYRLGDVMRYTKNNAGSSYNKRNFSLLGDPAMRMTIPNNKVITTQINSIPLAEFQDTLKALGKVEIAGYVCDRNQAILSDFNGTIYPIVYDKKTPISTLSNNGDAPYEFQVQNNIIYKGKASVTNGKFRFSFIVPKDISYKTGFGKISYYFEDAQIDGNGFYDKIIIGGTPELGTLDEEGPEIELFMNDKNFVNGSITNETPKLLAFITDSSGINTVGNGIGHDIMAVLDEETKKKIVLNDFYEADKDSYKKGVINYPLSKLKNGAHKINVKVWDVFNNSSDAEIDFIVADSENFEIKNVLNYPNPFTENTWFYFEHNKPQMRLEIIIQIYTAAGKLIKTITGVQQNQGFKSDAIAWNGFDDYGDKIGRGVYIYKLSVKTDSGEKAEKIEKLLLLK